MKVHISKYQTSVVPPGQQTKVGRPSVWGLAMMCSPARAWLPCCAAPTAFLDDDTGLCSELRLSAQDYMSSGDAVNSLCLTV